MAPPRSVAGASFTPRRSRRGTSHLNDENPQAVFETVTPARSSKKVSKGQPAALVKSSNSYGASGREDVAEGLVATTTGFTEQFAHNRQAVVDQPIADATVEAQHSFSEESLLRTDKSFSNAHEGGLAHLPLHLEPLRTGFYSIFGYLRGPYMWFALLGLLVFIIGSISSVFLFKISHKVNNTFDLVTKAPGLNLTGLFPSVLDAFDYDDRYKDFYSARGTIEERVRRVENDNLQLIHFLDQVRSDLPHKLVLVKNHNGERVLTDEFLRAMHAKWTADINGNTSSRIYDAFIDWNAKKVAELFFDPGTSYDVAQRDEVLEMMSKHAQDMEELIDSRLKKALSHHPDIIIEKLQRMYAESLAYFTLTKHELDTLSKPNFFSIGVGTRIDPFYTSPTKSIDPSQLRSEALTTKFMRKLFYSPQPHTPIHALTRWDEPGDCWCAAPTPGMPGVAQLTVNLAHPVFPSQVTVEHLPKAVSLDIKTAPKDIEFWAHVPGKTRQEIMMIGLDDCSDVRGDWICLGRFQYDVDAPFHVQTFNLEARLDSLGPTTQTMVRVLSTWGSDYTCLYRLRLYGELAQGEVGQEVVVEEIVEIS